MNNNFTFKIVKEGQIMEIDSPRGLVDLDTALRSISYLQPFDLVSWTANDNEQRRGWF